MMRSAASARQLAGPKVLVNNSSPSASGETGRVVPGVVEKGTYAPRKNSCRTRRNAKERLRGSAFHVVLTDLRRRTCFHSSSLAPGAGFTVMIILVTLPRIAMRSRRNCPFMVVSNTSRQPFTSAITRIELG